MRYLLGLCLVLLLTGCETFLEPQVNIYESQNSFSKKIVENSDGFKQIGTISGPQIYVKTFDRHVMWKLTLQGDIKKDMIVSAGIRVAVGRSDWAFYKEFCTVDGDSDSLVDIDRSVSGAEVIESFYVPLKKYLINPQNGDLKIRIYGDKDVFDLVVPSLYLQYFVDATVGQSNLERASHKNVLYNATISYTDSIPSNKWMRRIYKSLDDAINREGLSGSKNDIVKVRFTVSGGGNISEFKIVETSKNNDFNKAVSELFAQVVSVEPTPNGLSYTVDFSFKAKNPEWLVP